jgi:hypothetical protein
MFTSFPACKPTVTVPRPWRSQPVWVLAWLRSQSNKLPCGGARHGGNRAGSTEGSGSFLSRWVRGVVHGCTVYGPKDGIFSRACPAKRFGHHHRVLDAGDDSERATTGPAGRDVDAEDAHQALRLRLIAARRSAGVGSCPSLVAWRWLPLPRFAGVTKARC